MTSRWSVLLTSMCTWEKVFLLFLGGVFCRCQLRVLDVWADGLVCYSITYWKGMAKPQEWICLFLLEVLPVFATCILTLLLGIYILKSILSSWRNDSFIIMSCPTRALIIVLALKSTLNDIIKVTPTFFWLVLAWHIFLSLFSFKVVSWVFFFDPLWQYFNW